jgi:hypothetical protein
LEGFPLLLAVFSRGELKAAGRGRLGNIQTAAITCILSNGDRFAVDLPAAGTYEYFEYRDPETAAISRRSLQIFLTDGSLILAER